MIPVGPSGPLPPHPSLLQRSTPTLLRVVAGIARAVTGSIAPGAGALQIALSEAAKVPLSAGLGRLFLGGEEVRPAAPWQRQLVQGARARRGRERGLLDLPEASPLAEQIALGELEPKAGRPGASGLPVPGLQSEALRRFLT